MCLRVVLLALRGKSKETRPRRERNLWPIAQSRVLCCYLGDFRTGMTGPYHSR